jgi:hypothetical protein
MTMPESGPNNPQRRAFDRGLRDGRSGSHRKLPENESLKRHYNNGYLVGSVRRQLALLKQSRRPTAE